MWLLALLLVADTSGAFAVQVAPEESLWVRVSGYGDPVVLVPGLLGSGFGYRTLAARLNSAGYRTIIVDPLGVGRSTRPKHADYSLSAQADRLAAVLDSLNVRDALIVAHSVGAGIAFRLAYKRPDLTRGLISLDGGPAEAATTPGFRKAMRLAPLIKFLGVGLIRHQIHRFMIKASGDTSWVTREVVQGYTAGAVANLGATVDAYRAMADSREPEALEPHLGAIRSPVLLLVGRVPHDGAIRPEEVSLLAERLPTFAVDTIPEVGHFPHEEAPEVVVQAVDRMRATITGGTDDWLGPGESEASITVMTRNVYIGTNVDKVIAASTLDEIPLLVAEAYLTLLATDFRERAEALAGEIAATEPHLVGLQEISTIRRQSQGDAFGGGTSAAQYVLFDYLEILLDALRSRGLEYRVAAVVQNADVEVPMLTGFDPLSFDDIRFTDFDVTLARGDVAISNVLARNYAAKLTVPVGDGFAFEILRGFTAVDATVGRNTYRFVNTHLEPEVLAVRQAQAAELIDALRNEPLPVIVVGDLNTPAPDGVTYNMFLDALYVDVWTRRVNAEDDPGYTANHADDLRNETVTLHKRIDFILARNEPGSAPWAILDSVFAIVVGDELQDRTPSGLWPSDHAGLVARMVILELGEGAGRGEK